RDSARRRRVLAETLRVLQQAETLRVLQLARANHARWADQAEPSPAQVDVQIYAGDWGEVTLDLSRRYGQVFAVLNMANAYVPGGGYIEGAASQEENLYRRSDCHFHIRDEDYDRETDRYRPHMTELISGVNGRVYLDTRQPRVCIRGAEDPGQPNLGYRWLDEDEIFSFFELRSAAQDLRRGDLFDPDLARRQVAAQLDTLIEAGVRHAVLGAFGCGAFRNPADQVAAIYRQEVDKRREAFSILAFAIRHMPYSASNLLPFQRAFAGA
ncbi:MAG: poly(ADP-ribose) glycohydrolase domain-containing protein, partial [Wenzhouxiangella sp.]